jgi:hypothetical protein
LAETKKGDRVAPAPAPAPARSAGIAAGAALASGTIAAASIALVRGRAAAKDAGKIVAGPARIASRDTKPKARKAADSLIEASLAAVIERVPEIVHARQEKLSQENIDLLVDAYLKSPPTAPARHAIEMDNARERARFVEEFPCYTSREVADLAGHEAANASATATRWKKARRIVGLPWKGSDLYPAFQFREGRPRPIVGRLIEQLPRRMSPWQIAFWLTSTNGWLGGATPLQRLDEEAALLAAAAREGEAPGG